MAACKGVQPGIYHYSQATPNEQFAIVRTSGLHLLCAHAGAHHSWPSGAGQPPPAVARKLKRCPPWTQQCASVCHRQSRSGRSGLRSRRTTSARCERGRDLRRGGAVSSVCVQLHPRGRRHPTPAAPRHHRRVQPPHVSAWCLGVQTYQAAAVARLAGPCTPVR